MTRSRWARILRRMVGVVVVLTVVVGGYAGVVAARSNARVDLLPGQGRFAVGRVEDTATDPGRDGRRLSVWTWYPAAPGTGTAAAYAPGAWSALAIGLPLGETSLARVHDSALEGAAPAAGRFPVVVLMPGLGLAVPQYAVIAEDLASRGYVVAGVTPTGSANVTVLDGRVMGPTADGNPSDFAGEQTAHDRAVGERLLSVWVGDARFGADTAGRLSESVLLARHLDADRVAYVGHSFGGSTALEACHEDARCFSAVNLDGALYGPVATQGLGVPSLLLAHDGSCITGDCTPGSAEDRADAAAGTAYVSASTGTVRRMTVEGTGHLDFTDYALYYWALPLRHLLALGDADGRHTLRQTCALIAGTLDRP